MKTKFAAINDRISPKINPIKIVRETKHFIVCALDNGHEWKESKHNYMVSYHDTYDNAKLALADRCSKQIEFYQNCLQTEIEKLKQIIEL